jgi:rhamnosyl/mannosyltransferase
VPYYQAANSFWFPSNARSESFGLAQVEAMASGCPVINTAIPNSGVSWVSQNGISGMTVPVGDSAELARCADLLANDDNLRAGYAAGARLRAMQEFDIRVMVDRLSRLYSEVLGSNTNVPADREECEPGHKEPARMPLLPATA